jgi:Zn-dependent protease
MPMIRSESLRDIFSMPSDETMLGGKNDNIELLKAWAGTTLAYAVALRGGQIFSVGFLFILLIAAVTCGVGFVLHELAHRVLARQYGAQAHFVANNGWLLISIVLAFTGFFIAAPGAVWHRGYLTPRQGGLIALGGPVTNLILAALFLLLSLITPSSSWLGIVASVGYNINAWLGLFNMIPAGPFDGAKVLNWNWQVFAVTVAVGIGMVFLLPQLIAI